MSKEFKTDNLALCPFLMLQGLNYIRAELSIGKFDKPTVYFIFEDPIGIARDLEIDFVRSDFKKYRDMSFFFRNEIEKIKRKMERLSLEESRENDEKYIDEYQYKKRKVEE